jgi:hypothetical protein
MPKQLTATEDAQQAGFDPSLIEANLRCTYEERVLRHQSALDLMLELSRIGEDLRGRDQPTAAAPLRR